MRLHADDLLGLHFVLHLDFLRDVVFGIGWEDEDVAAWGESVVGAIADDDENDAYPDPERRLGLLLSLPAWSLHMHEQLPPAAHIARAIRNARGDASSIERSALMDGDELLDFATMFDYVKAFARTSAILDDGDERIVSGEYREEILGLAILPAFAAFETVWRLACGDPDQASEMARELAEEILTGEEIEDD